MNKQAVSTIRCVKLTGNMRPLLVISVAILFCGSELFLQTQAGTVFKTITRNGTGNMIKNGDNVVVHYVGTLTNGRKFDSSRDRNEPFTFKIGAGQVISGWDAGVASMQVGERSTLEISPEDGYGVAGAGTDIPPNATLLFDIEVLRIDRRPSPSQAGGAAGGATGQTPGQQMTGNGQFGMSGSARTNQFGTSSGSGANQFGLSGGAGANQFGTSGGPGANQFGMSGGAGANQFGTSGGAGTNQFGMSGGAGTSQFGMSGSAGANQFGMSGGAGANQFGMSSGAGTNQFGMSSGSDMSMFGNVASDPSRTMSGSGQFGQGSSGQGFGSGMPDTQGTSMPAFGSTTAFGSGMQGGGVSTGSGNNMQFGSSQGLGNGMTGGASTGFGTGMTGGASSGFGSGMTGGASTGFGSGMTGGASSGFGSGMTNFAGGMSNGMMGSSIDLTRISQGNPMPSMSPGAFGLGQGRFPGRSQAGADQGRFGMSSTGSVSPTGSPTGFSMDMTGTGQGGMSFPFQDRTTQLGTRTGSAGAAGFNGMRRNGGAAEFDRLRRIRLGAPNMRDRFQEARLRQMQRSGRRAPMPGMAGFPRAPGVMPFPGGAIGGPRMGGPGMPRFMRGMMPF